MQKLIMRNVRAAASVKKNARRRSLYKEFLAWQSISLKQTDPVGENSSRIFFEKMSFLFGRHVLYSVIANELHLQFVRSDE